MVVILLLIPLLFHQCFFHFNVFSSFSDSSFVFSLNVAGKGQEKRSVPLCPWLLSSSSSSAVQEKIF